MNWYFVSQKSGQLMKKSLKNVTIPNLLSEFCKKDVRTSVAQRTDVVAVLVTIAPPLNASVGSSGKRCHMPPAEIKSAE